MKRFSPIILSVLLLATLPGLGDDARQVKAVDFFPMIPEMEWHYSIVHTANKRTRSFPLRVKVESDKREYKGQQARSFKTRLTSGRRRKEVLQREFFCLSKKGEILCFRRDNGPVEVPLVPAQIILKATLFVGQKWVWKGAYKGRAASCRFEVRRFEKLTLAKNNYDCVVIGQITETMSPKSHQDRTLWFARGVGLVKEEAKEKLKTGDVKLVGQLTNYSRPGKPEKKKPETGKKK